MQCITTCPKSSTSTSDQDTIVTKPNDCLMPSFYPFGVPYMDSDKESHGVELHTVMETMTDDQDTSIFHSVEISTFSDIFSDEATMKWMAAATTEETEVDMSTTVSDDMSPDHCDHVDDVDDTVLGEFLWDALVCT
jgi:hypothetical protein